jgi:hypothetical protein
MRSWNQLSLLATICIVGSCELVVADNPYDPQTPADLQAPATVRGRIVLRDGLTPDGPVGERAALDAITVTVRDSTGRLVEQDDVIRAVALTSVDVSAEEDAGVGFFVVSDLLPDTYSIEVLGVPEAYEATAPRTVTLGPGVDIDVGDLEYVYGVGADGPYGIDGIVTSAGAGGGVPRVSLFVWAGGGPVLAATTAVAGGAFRFSGLWSGTYAVVAEGDAVAPAYRLDVPVGTNQPQTSYAGDEAITLQPVTAVLLPITSGTDGVAVVERTNYVRGAPVPVAVLSFSTDVINDVGVTRMRLSTDPLFQDDAGDDIPFVPYAASATVPLPDEDGPHTIHAQFEASSAAGFSFSSPVFTLDVVRDTAAPRVVAATLTGLETGSDGIALSPSRTVAVRAELQDDTSAVGAVGVGGDAAPDTLDLVVAGTGSVRVERSLTFADDGLHTVLIVARDRAGNVTDDLPAATLQVHIDTVPPDITLDVENADGGVLTGRTARLRVASRDPADAVLVDVGVEGDALVPTGDPGVFELLLPSDATPDSVVTFEALAVDAVGNEARVTRSVTLPPAPTAPQLVIDGGATATPDRVVAVRFSALHATSARLVSGTTSVSYPANDFGRTLEFTLPDTDDGEVLVTAVFADDAGNTVSTSDSIVLDRVAPTLLAPVALGPVQEEGGVQYVTSVSATLSVLADGADEMAVVVDGAVDGEVFQPFAGNVVVLLPSGDGPKRICVHLRDEAGNERPFPVSGSDDACVDVVLDTDAPSAPVPTAEDGQVLKPPGNALFTIGLAPLDADVVLVRATVEGAFRDRPVVAEPVDASRGLESIAVPLFSNGATEDETRNLVRLVAVDRAGNESAQATLTVIVDEKQPALPTIFGGTVVAPGVVVPNQRLDDTSTRPPKVNADTFTVRLRSRPQLVDRNFDRYEIARTEGFIEGWETPRETAFTDSAGTDALIFTLRQGAPLNGLPGNTAGCSPRACLNHLFVRAVDAAGNVGPMLRIDVIEDSGPPTRPTLSPRSGVLVAAEADVTVEVESFDDGDICFDGADCVSGTCVNHTCVDTNGEGLPVHAYEVKQGTDGAFGGVPGGQPVAGPWRLSLVRSDDNEVCARGVDEAGNVGIEDCAVFTEAQRALRVATNADERNAKIAGDYLLFRADGALRIADLKQPSPTSGTESVVLEEMTVDRSDTFDIAAQLVQGRDLVAIVATSALQGGLPGSSDRGDYVQVRFGAPTSGGSDPGVLPINRLESQRTFRGRGASLATPRISGSSRAIEVAFACGTDPLAPTTSLSTVTIVRGRIDLLYANPTAPAGVGDGSRNNLGPGGTCPAMDGVIFRRVATLVAGRDLCTNTEPRIDEDATVWCETATRGGPDEAGEIKAVVNGALVNLGPTSTTAHGSLVDVGTGTPIQPLVTSTRLVWVDADRKLKLRSRASGNVSSLDLVIGELFDADSEQVLFSTPRADGLTNDGLTDDLYLLDLARSTTPQRLTDDLVPNTDGSIEAGRVASTAQSSTDEDIELFTLGDDAWLESGDSLRFSPVTSGSIAAWIDIVDEDLGLVVEDLATGVQIQPLVGETLRSQLTFAGGRSLGRGTHDTGGERVALMSRTAADPRRFAVRIFDFAPPLAGLGPITPLPFVTLVDVANVDADDTDVGTAAFDLSDDGRLAAWVDVDDSLLRVATVEPGRTTGHEELFAVPTGYVAGPSAGAGVIPFVDVQGTADGAVVVWQEGNVPFAPHSPGDPRSDHFGALRCAESRGGLRRSGTIEADVTGTFVPLAGRAPDIALTPMGLVLAFSARSASPDGRARRQTSICMLDCGVTPPRCGPVVALDLPSEEAGTPVVTSSGSVLWPAAGGGGQQIVRYDVARNIRISLTAPLGDGLTRSDVSAAGNAAVWLDTRLGTSDVWRVALP